MTNYAKKLLVVLSVSVVVSLSTLLWLKTPRQTSIAMNESLFASLYRIFQVALKVEPPPVTVCTPAKICHEGQCSNAVSKRLMQRLQTVQTLSQGGKLQKMKISSIFTFKSIFVRNITLCNICIWVNNAKNVNIQYFHF